jgi:hypothetical protein
LRRAPGRSCVRATRRPGRARQSRPAAPPYTTDVGKSRKNGPLAPHTQITPRATHPGAPTAGSAPVARARRPGPRWPRCAPPIHNSTVCNVNFNVFAIPRAGTESNKNKKISPSVSQPFQMACAPRFRRACLCAASTFPSSRAPRHSFHFRLLHERPLRATSVHPDHVALGTR